MAHYGTEMRIMRILEDMQASMNGYGILDLKRSEPHSELDRGGIDIQVALDPNIYPYGDVRVFIQIKGTHIGNFIRRHRGESIALISVSKSYTDLMYKGLLKYIFERPVPELNYGRQYTKSFLSFYKTLCGYLRVSNGSANTCYYSGNGIFDARVAGKAIEIPYAPMVFRISDYVRQIIASQSDEKGWLLFRGGSSFADAMRLAALIHMPEYKDPEAEFERKLTRMVNLMRDATNKTHQD